MGGSGARSGASCRGYGRDRRRRGDSHDQIILGAWGAAGPPAGPPSGGAAARGGRAAAQALATAPAAQAATTTTFTYTGGEQTYPVPMGTTAVTITPVGASGGVGNGAGG